MRAEQTPRTGHVPAQPFTCIIRAEQMIPVNRKCGYCGQNKQASVAWHDCPRAQAARQRLSEIIAETVERQIGGPEYTGTQDEVERLHTMRTGAKLAGLEVKDINYVEDIR